MTDEVRESEDDAGSASTSLTSVATSLGGIARLLAAIAVVAATPAVRPLALAGALAAALVIYAVLSGWQSLSTARWRDGFLRWGDVAVAAAAGAVVAAVAKPALIPLGAAAVLPLVVTGAVESGQAAGWRIGGVAVAAGALTAVAAGQPLAGGGVLILSPIVLWLTRAGTQAAAVGRTAAAQETEAARIRTEMVTTVSHELRTPLTVIKGAMATLSRRWDVLSEPERLDLIDVLIDNVASLDASILHFVDAGRLEMGSFVVQPEWVDFPAVVNGVTSKLGSVLAGHELQLDLEATRVWADPKALARILEHLLVNATRFSPIGLPIKVRSALQDPEVVISVSDRGQGIAPHLINTIWEPLQRGDVSDTGVSRGAGLGLPIVRELARLHGGDADLMTVKGRGTTVTVRLPLPAEREGAPAPPPSRARWHRRRVASGGAS